MSAPRVMGISTRRHEEKRRPSSQELRDRHAAKMRERNASNILKREGMLKVWEQRRKQTQPEPESALCGCKVRVPK
jgi:hypothetical protein